MAIRVVMLGDIVGRCGLLAVTQLVPLIRRRWEPHLLLANAENAAAGSGLTPDLYRRLRAAGLDGLTLGDHVYKRAGIIGVLDDAADIIRPANLPRSAKGRRWMALRAPGMERPLHVVTVLGRLHCTLPVDEPFAVLDEVLDEVPEKDPLILVEVHAEATAEKQALAWHLDGRVAAVVGTHTHVPTADARLLNKGTAYMTDLGMCGPFESVIGRRIDRVLIHLTSAMPAPFDVADGDPRVCGALIEIDPQTGRALAIERIELKADPQAPPFAPAS